MQVKGSTDNGKLLSILRPKVVIPLLNAEFESTGPLSTLVKVRNCKQLISRWGDFMLKCCAMRVVASSGDKQKLGHKMTKHV